jgi:hypothetical protein
MTFSGEILNSKLVTWLTVALLVSSQLIVAQTELKIVIIEGEGGVNNIKKGTATKPVVEVRDRNDKPVAGAAVLFALPDLGPSGTFTNGSRFLTVTTDANGRAAATSFRPNNVVGQFKIDVRATYQGQTGSATITQTNALAAAAAGAGGGISALTIGIIAGAAAAAAAGIAIGLTRGGGNDTARIGFGTGAVVVGPPH